MSEEPTEVEETTKATKKERRSEDLPLPVTRMIVQDLLDFFLANKFQWFLIITVLLMVLSNYGYIDKQSFDDLLRWNIGGLFGAEALREASKYRS